MDLRHQFEALLARAETMFGPRNTSFVVDRIYYVDDESVPNRLVYPARGHVDIQLTKSARGDVDRTLVQLSHETVHTLWPIGVDGTLVIEEGAATYFSMVAPVYIDTTYPDRLREGLTGIYSSWLAAERDVRALLSFNPAAIRDARRARSFCEISAEDLVAVGCESDVAQRLVAKFALSHPDPSA